MAVGACPLTEPRSQRGVGEHSRQLGAELLLAVHEQSRLPVEDGLLPIRQVDRTTIPEGQAIRIRPGVVGNLRELLVDPDQPLLVTGATALAASGVAEALIPAHHLIDGDRVRAEWLPARQAVTLSFDRALTLYVEGAGVGSCDDLSAVIGTDRQRVSRAS